MKKVALANPEIRKLDRKVNSDITYNGEVTISLKKGSRIVKTTTHKNSGCSPLFRFLAKALSGASVTELNHERPNFLKLFQGGKPGDEYDEAKLDWTTNITNTPIVAIGTVSDSYTAGEGGNPYKGDASIVTYKFMVPYINISNIGDKTINLLGIYSKENYFSDKNENPSAYFAILDEKEGKIVWGDLLGGAGNNLDDSYSIIIQWKMVIKNLEVEE